MRALCSLLALSLLPTAGLSGALAAQAPGYRGPSASQLRAEYRAEVISRVNEAMDAWSTSWSRDDLEQLAELYREDATVVEDGASPIRGPDAIREWLAERLAGDGQAQAFLQDFDARGAMAMAHSVFRIEAADGSATDIGNLITIFILEGRHWRIRSQWFTRGEAGGPAESPPA